MKITTLGVIQAVKNIGLFLGSYAFSGIKANPEQFTFAFLIYACVSIPSDLYLLNHASNQTKTETEG